MLTLLRSSLVGFCCIVILSMTTKLVFGQGKTFQEKLTYRAGEMLSVPCKAELLLMYQPSAVVGWYKNGRFIEIMPNKIDIDETFTLNMMSITSNDAAVYTCQLTYWDTTVVTNEVAILSDSKKSQGPWIVQHNGATGANNLWIVSSIGCVVILLSWMIAAWMIRRKTHGHSGYQSLDTDESDESEEDEDEDSDDD